MSRIQLLLPLTCLILLGVCVACWRRPVVAIPVVNHPMVQPTPTARAEMKVHQADTHSTVEAGTSGSFNLANEKKSGERPGKSETSSELSNLAASSWENPFSPDLWLSEGWTFSSDGMRSPSTGTADATFLRPYKRLMFECDLLALVVPESSEPGSWELRLTTEAPRAVMTVRIQSGMLAILKSESGGSPHLIIEKSLPVSLSSSAPRQIRIAATGNRIILSWDHKRFLTTEQLLSQSGRELTWSIHANGEAFQIPRLRVEGD